MALPFHFVVLLFVPCFLGISAEETNTGPCRTCPTGWTHFGQRCFMFNFRPQDWADAERACLAAGGNLASVHNKDEQRVITSLIDTAAGSHLRTWLGGSDAVKDGVWFWSDGTNFSYTNWFVGQPDNSGNKEHCLETNYEGASLWNDQPCTSRRAYVCAKNL